MIKYLECPDLHFDPKWPDVNELIGRAVCLAATDNAVDFIALPGDLMNSHLIATTAGGLPALIEIVKSWLAVCQVCAIEGTPSHDGPGAYSALEEAGLVLLRPGRVYGYYQGADGDCIRAIYPDNGCMNPGTILFGVPELDTANIHARLSVGAEEANAEAVNALGRYIELFIAPERARFSNIPAIGLLHGVVSDSAQEFSNDVIVRSSDIVIKTEMLERAGLDRWSLGHIHTPWESKRISAGYAGFAGIDNNPWGKTGFTPGMNLVMIDNGVIIERIPYGTPRREKITRPLEVYDAGTAYWLDTDDPEAAVPGGHPWSRVMHRAQKQETRRITKEEAAHVTTLVDLFRVFDPGVTERVLKKVGMIEETIPPAERRPVNARLTRVVVKGSIFWRGRTMDFDLSSLPAMALLMGDNGDGKSALASFCSPYPCVIGKDTKSGRTSAIKDFFSEKDSSIEKFFIVNGAKHRHLITLKGAHRENAKIEGFIYIDEVPVTTAAMTFDEMMAECERLYGPFADYFLTSFYAQPLQGKTSSGLMNASMTDIRDLVQSIAGIDREKEKRYALDRVKECAEIVRDKETWIKGAEENLGDEESLQTRKRELTAALAENSDSIAQAEERQEKATKIYTAAEQAKRKNDAEIERRRSNEERRRELETEIVGYEHAIAQGREQAQDIDKLTARVTALQTLDSAMSRNAKLKNAYDALVVAYNRQLAELQETIRQENIKADEEHRTAKRTYDDELGRLNRVVDKAKSTIDALNRPCYYCGKLHPKAEEEIGENLQIIKDAEAELAHRIEPTAPVLKQIPKELDTPKPTAPQYESIPAAEGDVDEAIAELKRIGGNAVELNKRRLEDTVISRASLASIKYEIDNTIDDKYDHARKALDDARAVLSSLRISRAQYETELKEVDKALVSIGDTKEKITIAHQAVDTAAADEADWNYIATNLQASKIPAMELDIVLDEIDEEATRNIEPYRDGVFSFHTVTQQEGKKSAVDRFDIRINDNSTGVERSFLEFSPGMKAFPNDAYVKALIKKRNERAHRSYSPIIIDEADGQIKGDHVYTYFEMQEKYFARSGVQVLVVSQHEKEAQAYIQAQVSIKELLNKN